MPKAHVVVYSRPECHLCDELKQVIHSAGCSDQFTFEEINIDIDAAAYERYKYDIPVVLINGVETFMHRINADEFRKKVLLVNQTSDSQPA